MQPSTCLYAFRHQRAGCPEGLQKKEAPNNPTRRSADWCPLFLRKLKIVESVELGFSLGVRPIGPAHLFSRFRTRTLSRDANIFRMCKVFIDVDDYLGSPRSLGASRTPSSGCWNKYKQEFEKLKA